MQPRYPFVSVDISKDDADDFVSLLFGLGATGVEQRDEQTLMPGRNPNSVTLVAGFSTPAEAEQAANELQDLYPTLSFTLDEVVGDSWRDAWKQHFEPFNLTPKITVVPPWLDYKPQRKDEMILILDPGRAFGTGLHTTTALCAQIIEELAPDFEAKEVLDIGTGSGILALVALLHGADNVVGLDIDPEAIEVARENARLNDLVDHFDARVGGIEKARWPCQWIVANIDARSLYEIAPRLVNRLVPSSKLILSGILASEADTIIERFLSVSRKVLHVETRTRGDAGGEPWVAIVLGTRPKRRKNQKNESEDEQREALLSSCAS